MWSGIHRFGKRKPAACCGVCEPEGRRGLVRQLAASAPRISPNLSRSRLELNQLHLRDRSKVRGAGVDLDAGQQAAELQILMLAACFMTFSRVRLVAGAFSTCASLARRCSRTSPSHRSGCLREVLGENSSNAFMPASSFHCGSDVSFRYCDEIRPWLASKRRLEHAAD